MFWIQFLRVQGNLCLGHTLLECRVIYEVAPCSITVLQFISTTTDKQYHRELLCHLAHPLCRHLRYILLALLTGPVGSIIYADLYRSINQICGIDPKCRSIKIFADQCGSIPMNSDQYRSMQKITFFDLFKVTPNPLCEPKNFVESQGRSMNNSASTFPPAIEASHFHFMSVNLTVYHPNTCTQWARDAYP